MRKMILNQLGKISTIRSSMKRATEPDENGISHLSTNTRDMQTVIHPPKMRSFAELIRSEEEILQRLLLVSQRQLEIVEAGNITVLIQYLGMRQQLWGEFELLEQQLGPHKGIAPESRSWKSAAERQLTESALNRCKDLLEKILENDQICLTKTAAQKDEVEKQLHRVQRGGNVALAYMRQS